MSGGPTGCICGVPDLTAKGHEIGCPMRADGTDEIPPSPSGREPYRDEFNTTDDADRAYRAACFLLSSLSRRHFNGRKIRPLPTLSGVITQIDNATFGLVKAADLRDEFAKHALTCIPHIGCGADLEIVDIAGVAYQMADAMLDARRGPGGEA